MFIKKIRAVAQLVGFLTIALLAGYGALAFFQYADSATAAPVVQESGNGELSVAAVAAASEFVPGYVNYQGVLRNAEGNLLTGTYTMEFRIYDDPTGSIEDGHRLWWSQYMNVPVRDGYFSLLLGSVAEQELPADIFNGKERYIGIQLESSDEMTPRQQFATVPYAYRADQAGGLTSKDGQHLDQVIVANDGRVGVGTTEPGAAFHVKGSTGQVGIMETSHTNIWLQLITKEGRDNRVEVANRAGGRLALWVAEGLDSLNILKNGWVGIGTTNPLQQLHVVGNQLVEGNWIRAQNGAKTISFETGGTEVDLQSVGADLFIRSKGGKDVVINSVGNDGNVGIGTSVPAEKLHVKGTARFDGDIQWSGSLMSFTVEKFTAETNISANVSNSPVTMTPVDGSFCALTDVNITTLGQEQTVACHIWIDSDNNWELRAWVPNTNSSGRAYCEARCLRWDNQ